MIAALEVFATEAEWLAARRQAIGASEVAALFGLSTHTSPFRLWAEKSGFAEPVDLSSEPFVKRGRRLEQFVADDYAENTGHEVTNLGQFALRRDEKSKAVATLDREIKAPERGPGALECKTAHAFLAHSWDDGAPLVYQIQLQTQLACTGWDWGVLACLIAGDDFRHFEYQRNDELIAIIREKVAAFWKCVESGSPPEPDAHDATRAALKQMFPEAVYDAIELPADAALLDVSLQQAKAEIKRWEAVEKACDAKLRYLIGAHAAGTIGGVTYTLKEIKRAGFTVAPTQFRQLRRKEGTK